MPTQNEKRLQAANEADAAYLRGVEDGRRESQAALEEARREREALADSLQEILHVTKGSSGVLDRARAALAKAGRGA